MEATGFSWVGSASSGLAADDLVSSSSGTATYAEVFAESHSFSTVLQIKGKDVEVDALFTLSLSEFIEELKAAALEAGFKIKSRGVKTRASDSELTVRLTCQHDRKHGNYERATSRDHRTLVTACGWSVHAKTEQGRRCVRVTVAAHTPHNHAPRTANDRVPDLDHELRELGKRLQGKFSAPQVAQILNECKDMGSSQRLGYISSRFVEGLFEHDVDTSVAVLLRVLASAPDVNAVVFAIKTDGKARTLQIYKLDHTFLELLGEDIHTELAATPCQERGQRKDKQSADRSAIVNPNELSHLVTELKQVNSYLVQDRIKASKAAKKQIKQRVSGHFLGRGNHGAMKNTGLWAEFLLGGFEHEFEAVVFAHAAEQILFKRYPEVVHADVTHGTNKRRLDLADAVGVDGENQNVVVARAFLRNQERVSMEYFFVGIQLLYGKSVCKSVLLCPVDGDGNLHAAAQSVFSNAKIRECGFHTITQRFQKAGRGGGKKGKVWRNLITDLLWVAAKSVRSEDVVDAIFLLAQYACNTNDMSLQWSKKMSKALCLLADIRERWTAPHFADRYTNNALSSQRVEAEHGGSKSGVSQVGAHLNPGNAGSSFVERSRQRHNKREFQNADLLSKMNGTGAEEYLRSAIAHLTFWAQRQLFKLVKSAKQRQLFATQDGAIVVSAHEHLRHEGAANADDIHVPRAARVREWLADVNAIHSSKKRTKTPLPPPLPKDDRREVVGVDSEDSDEDSGEMSELTGNSALKSITVLPADSAQLVLTRDSVLKAVDTLSKELKPRPHVISIVAVNTSHDFELHCECSAWTHMEFPCVGMVAVLRVLHRDAFHVTDVGHRWWKLYHTGSLTDVRFKRSGRPVVNQAAFSTLVQSLDRLDTPISELDVTPGDLEDTPAHTLSKDATLVRSKRSKRSRTTTVSAEPEWTYQDMETKFKAASMSLSRYPVEVRRAFFDAHNAALAVAASHAPIPGRKGEQRLGKFNARR